VRRRADLTVAAVDGDERGRRHRGAAEELASIEAVDAGNRSAPVQLRALR
jgi:hypothetical protein